MPIFGAGSSRNMRNVTVQCADVDDFFDELARLQPSTSTSRLWSWVTVGLIGGALPLLHLELLLLCCCASQHWLQPTLCGANTRQPVRRSACSIFWHIVPACSLSRRSAVLRVLHVEGERGAHTRCGVSSVLRSASNSPRDSSVPCSGGIGRAGVPRGHGVRLQHRPRVVRAVRPQKAARAGCQLPGLPDWLRARHALSLIHI